jgi:DNA polymerase III alpha subunit (gram-positive type)
MNRKLYPGLTNFRVGTVARDILGIEIDKSWRHRALDDAHPSARIWLKLRDMV